MTGDPIPLPERYELFSSSSELQRYVLEPPATTDAPVLVEGTELLGRYESPGMTDERYLLRRPDGQVVLLTLVLYLIASGLDAHRSLDEIAKDLSTRLHQPIQPTDVIDVIDAKLAPLGILATIDDAPPVAVMRAPLLSLSLKGTLFSPRAVAGLARTFGSLFWYQAVIAWVTALIYADVYTFGVHGVSSSLTLVAQRPVLFLPVLGIVVGSIIFHEIGHATACAYGGGKPGRIGYGVYLVFPAFYTDVTDTYRLSRSARVRTDLGGVYFNGVSIVVATLVLAVTNYTPIIPAIVFIHITMFQQMLPLVRLDGYYVLSDIVGVPDLYARIGPLMRSLIPGRHDPRAGQLRPAARRIVTAWILLTVPVLIIGFALFFWRLPNFIAESYDSFHAQWDTADLGLRQHRWATLALAVISMMLLFIPALGLSAFMIRLTRRIPTRRRTS
jgi:putative peptide zinc metalloprotease protein